MRLETVDDLLAAMRERGAFTSDNEMASGVGIPQTTISSFRRGRTFPTELPALRIARFLGISPALVLAIAAAARLRGRPESREWLRVARELARAA